MGQSTRQSVLFAGDFSKPVVATFDGDSQSSDGGLILLGALDRGLGLTRRLAACLVDRRDPEKIVHSLEEMFRQRVFSIAAGYPDCNDTARVGDDPVMKEVCGRGAGGAALASQPTLSRFENAAKGAGTFTKGREIIAMTRQLETSVIEFHQKRKGRKARLVTIDLDPTDDPTHGQQAFTFFNSHYGGFCFLPLLGFLSFDDEPDQHLFHARLRPGNATAGWRTAFSLLRRVVPQLRRAFPKARIRVRLDGGFNCPAMFALLEELKLEYLVGMAGNSRLDAAAEPLLAKARALSKASGLSAQVFGETQYQPKKKAKNKPWLSWPHDRRVIVKAEVVVNPLGETRDNPRFVVTNLRLKPEPVYGVYRGRGESENRIKELHHGLELDRTSCSGFLANQLRVLATATAYVLFQQLRLRAGRTILARAQVQTLRERLFKVGARVIQSVRRIVLHFPAAYPWQNLWRAVARSVGATVT